MPGAAAIILAAMAAAATLYGSWIMIRDSRKPDERADLRLSSWSLWSAAAATGTAGELAVAPRQLASGFYTGLDAAACMIVLCVAWMYGTREFSRLDAVCTVLAGAGIVMLAIAIASPRALPVWAAITISALTDLAAFIPTYRHGWADPGGEPWAGFAWFGLGGTLTLAAVLVHQPSAAGLIYPGYLLAANAAMVSIILARPSRQPARMAAFINDPL